MPINREELLDAVRQLAEHEGIQVTVCQSAKGACVVGASAFAGGLLGGPVGLAAGGVIGSFASLWMGRDKYKSVAYIIAHDMTPMQRQRLADNIQRVLQDVRPEDAVALLPLLMGNSPVRELVLKELVQFMQSEMHMAITS